MFNISLFIGSCHAAIHGHPCCVFPFTYKNKVYHDCTTVDFGDTYWCAITSNYDIHPNLYKVCSNEGKRSYIENLGST